MVCWKVEIVKGARAAGRWSLVPSLAASSEPPTRAVHIPAGGHASVGLLSGGKAYWQSFFIHAPGKIDISETVDCLECVHERTPLRAGMQTSEQLLRRPLWNHLPLLRRCTP